MKRDIRDIRYIRYIRDIRDIRDEKRYKTLYLYGNIIRQRG